MVMIFSTNGVLTSAELSRQQTCQGALEVQWTPQRISSNGMRAEYRILCWVACGTLILLPSLLIVFFDVILFFIVPYALIMIVLFSAIDYAGRNVGRKGRGELQSITKKAGSTSELEQS